MKATKNIAWYELVPKAYYRNNEGYASAFQRVMDQGIVQAGQWFIERWGTTYLNDWYWGGGNDSRGWRPADDPDGAALSQHKFGRALDGSPESASPVEVHVDIINNPQLYLDAGITTFETVWLTPSWVHMDNRWHGIDGLMFVDLQNAYTLEEYRNKLKDKSII